MPHSCSKYVSGRAATERGFLKSALFSLSLFSGANIIRHSAKRQIKLERAEASAGQNCHFPGSEERKGTKGPQNTRSENAVQGATVKHLYPPTMNFVQI